MRDHASRVLSRPWTWALAVAALLLPGEVLLAGLNTGAAFLRIGTGARPSAMGEAYTAVAEDVNALHYNPSGLARLPRQELGATHAEWLLGTKFDFVGYARPTSLGTFGLAFTRLAAGSQEGRTADRQAADSFEASDTAYTLSYSWPLRLGFKALAGRWSGSTSAGANVKLLQSRIAGYSASTWALDLGAQHRLDAIPLSLGAAVLNLGPGMRFLSQIDPLPLTLSVGGAYRVAGALQLALDVRRDVHDRELDVGLGTEYSLFPAFALRAGYASWAQAGGDSLGGLGGGFGLKVRDYRADYTFTPFGQLGNAQRISLGARW